MIILLGNSFFQISSYSCAYLRIIYEKTMGQVPLGPLLGKQNIQAKEVYSKKQIEIIWLEINPFATATAS